MSLKLKFSIWIILSSALVAFITVVSIIEIADVSTLKKDRLQAKYIQVFLQEFVHAHSNVQVALFSNDPLVLKQLLETQAKLIDTLKSGVVVNQDHLTIHLILDKITSLYEMYRKGNMDFFLMPKKDISNLHDSNLLFQEIFETGNMLYIDIDKRTSEYLILHSNIFHTLRGIAPWVITFLTLLFFALSYSIYKTFLLPLGILSQGINKFSRDDWTSSILEIKKISRYVSRINPTKEIKTFLRFLSSFLASVKASNEKLNQNAITDGKTNLYNFGYFEEAIHSETVRAKRFGQSLSILMVDVDYFKCYNDTNGHLEGDKALIKIARIIKHNVRETDIAARFGGEEFSVILPNTSKKDAVTLAERLRIAVERETFNFQEKQPNKNLTISIGISSYPEDVSNPDLLVMYADDALYKAKKSGKNMVSLYTKSMLSK